MPKLPDPTACRLQIVRRTGQFWITGRTPWNNPAELGPYSSRDEAEEDMEGVIRFHLYKEEPGYVSCIPDEARKPYRFPSAPTAAAKVESTAAPMVPEVDLDALGDDLI